ncbi:MAG: hypothetical protein HGA97_00825 [Chlorobiaceae bacterium]|nr:hypothetical protein [Chlorobiaceae bacterium]
MKRNPGRVLQLQEQPTTKNRTPFFSAGKEQRSRSVGPEPFFQARQQEGTDGGERVRKAEAEERREQGVQKAAVEDKQEETVQKAGTEEKQEEPVQKAGAGMNF